jgi:hypothetical protein
MLPLQVLNPVLGQLLGQAGKEINPFVRTTCGVVSRFKSCLGLKGVSVCPALLVSYAHAAVTTLLRARGLQVQIEAGGIAHNVLPRQGSIKLNFRVLPGKGVHGCSCNLHTSACGASSLL